MAETKKHKVPLLKLPKNPESRGHSARTVPTPQGCGRSMCPQCLHSNHIHPWRPWLSRGEMILVCSYQSTRAVERAPTAMKYRSGFCGHTFVKSRELAVCTECRSLLRVRERDLDKAEDDFAFFCELCECYETRQ